MKPIFMLVYTSRAVVDVTPEVLCSILDTAEIRNKRDEITGFLVYRNGYFLQLIEGDETKVRALCEDIKADPRHTSIVLQGEAWSDSRVLAGWSMALIPNSKIDETESILSLLELGRRGERYSDKASLEAILRIFAKNAVEVQC